MKPTQITPKIKKRMITINALQLQQQNHIEQKRLKPKTKTEKKTG